MKRVFLIVLDSVGIGELPDAGDFGDIGSNTLAACAGNENFHMPNMQQLGLFNIDGVDCVDKCKKPLGAYGRLSEASKGKDTTIGHWEIAGVISDTPLPTFPNGFPKKLLQEFENRTGRKVICNKPYSGTEVIRDYGKEHVETGALIIYTSADSVFQIAAHEEVVSVSELYHYCEIARDLCTGEYGVGRVIARPFEGGYPDFKRTSNRHDYSLQPPEATMLESMCSANYSVIGVGKIFDIFAGVGISSSVRTKNNEEGIQQVIEYTNQDFEGLCFINLVDFDMVYGHRNDVAGYAKALSEFDMKLPYIIEGLKEEDILIITADHGCDPVTPSTDHSREYIPLIITGTRVKEGVDLGTRNTFADIAATILEYFNIEQKIKGTSFLSDIIRR